LVGYWVEIYPIEIIHLILGELKHYFFVSDNSGLVVERMHTPYPTTEYGVWGIQRFADTRLHSNDRNVTFQGRHDTSQPYGGASLLF